MQVAQGSLGAFNVLGTVSRASGVFGESTLRSLTSKLAAEGTPFDQMSGDVRLTGGKMQLDNILFRSPDFGLTGNGVVDLLTNTLDGEFRLSLSPEISALMRAEDSRAGRLFWNSRTKRVELPFTLSGPANAPRPGINFESIAKDRAKEELRDLISDRLGLKQDEPETPPPTQSVAPPGGEASDSAGAPAERTHPELTIEFTGTQWRGSFLARDLQISGKVSGPNIDRASFVLIDAQGRRIDDEDRIESIDTYLASAGDRSAKASIDWRVLVDGKRLLAADYPVTATVTVHNKAGESAQSSIQVDR
jgi:hypothetical protein